MLRINILNQTMAAKLVTDPAAFGVAFPGEAGSGVVGAVFHHRVAELQPNIGVKAALILGHILAHEIGHPLLGFRSHASHGIMSAQWDKNEIVQAEQGSLRFVSGQARRMRRQVRDRQNLEAGNLVSR